MLDSSGRVVGVNTAIFTNTGASAGIGFAIPIDVVRRIVPQLIQFGQVVRPSLNAQVLACRVDGHIKLSARFWAICVDDTRQRQLSRFGICYPL